MSSHSDVMDLALAGPGGGFAYGAAPVSDLAAIGLLVLAIVLIVVGAEVFFAGLLRAARALGVAPFAIVVVISGLEVENVAAGIAANASGLPGEAAGNFLGG